MISLMNRESNIAFALLRSAIAGGKPDLGTETLETRQWWNLFRLLQINHVAAMTAETVAALDVPREVKIPWLAESDKAIRWHRYQAEVQQDIVDTMTRHGIKTLVLKGTHTAQYYPQPEQREFGDLDLYFYDRHSEADAVARQELGVTIDNGAHHHSKYNYRGITVESHYDFLNTHYPPSNRHYEQVLKELAPSATFEVLFLLRHMAGHFAAARTTLRDLVDWSLTCRALQKEVDWDTVGKVINDYGMRPFVRALCSVAENNLDIQLPLTFDNNPSAEDEKSRVIHDMVYGSVDDHASNGIGRIGWKWNRWHTFGWKRHMVYSDSDINLWFASLASHLAKPVSIMNKM